MQRNCCITSRLHIWKPVVRQLCDRYHLVPRTLIFSKKTCPNDDSQAQQKGNALISFLSVSRTNTGVRK